MPHIDLTQSAADLGRLVEAGRLDPVELTEAFISEIKATPEAQRIYARTTPQRARAEALDARARAQNGTRRGPLDGVPISWKDLFDTAGVETESGSAMLKGRVPEHDAAVLATATRAGLICLGKTHQTELAFSGLGLNPVTATPPNVNDAARAPGGSSSGAATSVAFGLAAIGIGSDTGGSVRVPAAWNDLVGLKTSMGRLPMDGVVPLCPLFDTIGPLCRTVEDAALMLAAMGGGAAPDLGGDVQGMRFLVLETPAIAPLDPAPQAAFETAVARLSAAGARVETAASDAVEAAMPLAGLLFPPEAYATWSDTIAEKGDLMYPPVRARFEVGRGVSAPDYVRAWQTLERSRRAFAAETAGYDAVLMPSCPILPPVVEELLADEDAFTARNLETLRNTRVGNLMGSCGITLPAGTPSCGLMAIASAGQEARILQIGAAMEKSLLPA